jgi:hypothetical protein
MNIFNFLKPKPPTIVNWDVGVEGYVPLIKATFSMLSHLYTDANGLDKYKEILEHSGVIIKKREE